MKAPPCIYSTRREGSAPGAITHSAGTPPTSTGVTVAASTRPLDILSMYSRTNPRRLLRGARWIGPVLTASEARTASCSSHGSGEPGKRWPSGASNRRRSGPRRWNQVMAKNTSRNNNTQVTKISIVSSCEWCFQTRPKTPRHRRANRGRTVYPRSWPLRVVVAACHLPISLGSMLGQM